MTTVSTTIPKVKFLIISANRVVKLEDVYSGGLDVLCGLRRLTPGEPYPDGATDIRRLSDATGSGLLRRGIARCTTSTGDTSKSVTRVFYMDSALASKVGQIENCKIGPGSAALTINSASFPGHIRLG